MLEFGAREVNISLFYSFSSEKEFYLALALVSYAILGKEFHILDFSWVELKVYNSMHIRKELEQTSGLWVFSFLLN